MLLKAFSIQWLLHISNNCEWGVTGLPITGTGFCGEGKATSHHLNAAQLRKQSSPLSTLHSGFLPPAPTPTTQQPSPATTSGTQVSSWRLFPSQQFLNCYIQRDTSRASLLDLVGAVTLLTLLPWEQSSVGRTTPPYPSHHHGCSPSAPFLTYFPRGSPSLLPLPRCPSQFGQLANSVPQTAWLITREIYFLRFEKLEVQGDQGVPATSWLDPPTAERGHESSLGSLLYPNHEGSSSWPNHLPKASPLNTIVLVVRQTACQRDGGHDQSVTSCLCPSFSPPFSISLP